MKPNHWLILGSAFAGCTAAFGIYLAAKGPSPADCAPQTDSPRLQPASATKRHFSTSKNASSRAVSVSGTTARETGRDSPETAPEFRIHGKPPAGRVSDERAWFASAERVGRQANRELEKLRETLELSPNQQQRIFDILAQNSPSWQPGMLIGGSHGVGVVSETGRARALRTGDNPNNGEATPVAAMNDKVLAVLDADQQQALIEEEINRRAWWEEILPQLLPPEFPAAAGADNIAAKPLGDSDTKAYQGPTQILEE